MKSDKSSLHLIRLLILAALIAVLIPLVVSSDKTSENGSKREIQLSECFIEATKQPYYPDIRTLAMRGYHDLLDQYDWDTELMYKIMLCESQGGNPRVIGDKNTPYHSYGLLQVRNLPERNLNVEDLFIPRKNIKIAYGIWKNEGYSAWTNCWKRVTTH